MQGNMWFIPRGWLALAAHTRRRGGTDGLRARTAPLPAPSSASIHPLLFLEKGSFQKYYRHIRSPAILHCRDFLRLADVKRLEGGGRRRRSRRATFPFFSRFGSWIVNHINLLSYRPQWRLWWFMWFQLYGFVNLQPYIIHEFIFHVFFFQLPSTTQTRITMSDS